MRNFVSKIIAFAMITVMTSSVAFAHPGRTNKDGCHTNKKTGEYHCHNGNASKEAKSTARSSARTTANTRTQTYMCDFDYYNCSDFATHSETQSVYGYCMDKSGKDIHDLDRDNDGDACEALR